MMTEDCHMCDNKKFNTCAICTKPYCKDHEEESGLCQYCSDYPHTQPQNTSK